MFAEYAGTQHIPCHPCTGLMSDGYILDPLTLHTTNIPEVRHKCQLIFPHKNVHCVIQHGVITQHRKLD